MIKKMQSALGGPAGGLGVSPNFFSSPPRLGESEGGS